MSSKHNTPILVTGSHRSGTTWCGNVIALGSSAIHKVHEPFNPLSPPGMAFPPFHSMYAYVDGGSFKLYENALKNLCAGYYSPLSRHQTSVKCRLSLIKNQHFYFYLSY